MRKARTPPILSKVSIRLDSLPLNGEGYARITIGVKVTGVYRLKNYPKLFVRPVANGMTEYQTGGNASDLRYRRISCKFHGSRPKTASKLRKHESQSNTP